MTEEQLETIKKLLEHGITVELVLVDNEIAYRVSGFASSGCADLVPSEQCLFIAQTRHNQRDEIYYIDDILYLNKYLCDACGYGMGESWMNLAVSLGLAEKVEKTVTEFVWKNGRN